MTSLITDPAWGEEDFDRLEEFIRVAKLPCPTFTVLTPLPGTELWETSKARLTTSDYNLFDVMHLVLPTKLPPKRFFERFARLYCMMDESTRLSRRGLITLAKLVLRGKTFAVRRVLSASRELRNPRAYLEYPGSTPRPDFVPRDFGQVSWVERSRSYLTERAVVATG
jgi:magnesium-protoporphyrin IX monomethyl ester (oxidative) cyclase